MSSVVFVAMTIVHAEREDRDQHGQNEDDVRGQALGTPGPPGDHCGHDFLPRWTRRQLTTTNTMISTKKAHTIAAP